MKDTQRADIIAWLESGRPITQLEATEEIGCTRLAAQIFYLRKRGMNIKSELVQVPTRYGTATVARYYL